MSKFPGKAIALIVSLATLFGNPICSRALAAPIPLANVDIDRMYGGWHIIATIPNSFEKGIVAPYDVYWPADRPWFWSDFPFAPALPNLA